MPRLIGSCFTSLILLMVAVGMVQAQEPMEDLRNYQLSSPRVKAAWHKYHDSLKDQFEGYGLNWPPTDILLRGFKNQNELELWARNSPTEPYTHLANYPICATAGKLGPKRKQGDRQIPEGFYFIEDFNPNSNYHLSMLVSYPNYADNLKTKEKPGGDIYIHGGCVTIGCLPMTDAGIERIYTVCLAARLAGQEHIPVHLYPTRLNKQGIRYLQTQYANSTSNQEFWASLRKQYEYFEQYHKTLPVMYAPDGTYAN